MDKEKEQLKLKLEKTLKELENIKKSVDIDSIEKERKEIENYLSENRPVKIKIEQDVKDLKESIENLKEEENGIHDSLSKLNDDILNKKKEISELDTNIQTSSNSLDENNNLLNEVKNKLNDLEKSLKEINEDISDKSKKREDLETEVKDWERKNKLYSKDMAGISKSNNKQKKSYLIGILLSFICLVILVYFLISSLISKQNLIPDSLVSLLKDNPILLFYSFLLTRITLFLSIGLLIFVFIRLIRNFISQYIKTQEKMNSINTLDMMIDRIGSDVTPADKLIKELDLLEKYLPDLIKFSPSPFDKVSKIDK